MCNRSVREIRFLLMNSPVFAQEGLRGRGIEVRGVWGMRELFAGIWGKVCKGFDLFCNSAKRIYLLEIKRVRRITSFWGNE